MKEVIKRDGSRQAYDWNKIYNAILNAFDVTCEDDDCDNAYHAERVANMVANKFTGDVISIEDIQDACESVLMEFYPKTAKVFMLYREKHKSLRENTIDKTLEELTNGVNEYWNKENANKRAERTSTQRDYVAGVTSTDFARRCVFTPDVIKAHDEGIIHIHDMDYAIHKGITNCSLINLKDILDNGTVINDVLIESPHRFITACTIATQVMLQVASNQYGGLTISIAHLAPYLRKSKLSYKEKYPEYAEQMYKKELSDGIQTLNYQLNSFTASTGQSPFSTIHCDLEEDPEYETEILEILEELLKQRILGHKNEVGVYVTPAFPKIIVVLRDKYFTDPKYKDFINLCAECTAKRMVPDYMSEKNMLKYKGAIVPAMSCRSLLKPIYPDGKLKLYGRFNLGVCTINLPHVAYSSHNEEEFWKLLEERVNLCRKAQLIRVKRIGESTVDCAPLLWKYGAFTRYPSGTKLKEIIYGGFASISLGYAGLYECTKIMTGESQSGEKGFQFAEKVMQFLDNTTQKWAEIDNLGWSVYGTPENFNGWHNRNIMNNKLY